MAVNMVLLHSGQSFEICAHISLRVLVQGGTLGEILAPNYCSGSH